MAKITKDTTLEKILKIPGVEEILTKYNLPCLSCPLAAGESSYLKIGKIAEIYNGKADISGRARYKIDIKNLLKELNEKLKK